MSNVKKSVLLVVILSLLLSFSVSAESVVPFEGEGTQDNPYLIGTAEEMYRFAEIVNGGYSFEGEYLKLTSDVLLYDLSDKTAELVTTWTPIGADYSVAFRGSFDGDNHTIRGVYINSDKSKQALFGCMYGGAIRNVILSDSYIKGNCEVAGILAVTHCNDGDKYGLAVDMNIVENCVNNATIVNSGVITGGIVADGGIIKNCINNGDISSTSGSISGIAYNAHIVENCVNNGNVTGGYNVAGICCSFSCYWHEPYESRICGCTNNGTVRYKLSGYAITDVSKCKNVEDCINNGEIIHVSPEVHVHSYTVEEIPPTCTWQGYTSHVCDCGAVYYDNYVPELPHTPEDIGLKAPTCTTPGWKDGTKCSVCNEILSPAGAIPETGHSAEWVTVTDAQIGADGLEHFKCTLCGEVLEEKVIPAVKKGDINGDGKITAADARKILRCASKLDSDWDIYDTVVCGDFDNDGRLTAKDARQCLRYASGLDDYYKDFGVNIK